MTLSPIAARPPDGGPITNRLVTATHTDQAFQFRTGEALSYLASVRIRCSDATGGSLSAKLYSDNGSDQIGTELATSESDAIAASTSEFDVILAFSPVVPLMPGTKYWIGFADSSAASTDVNAQVVSLPYVFKSKDDANYRTDRTYRFALAMTPDNVEDLDGAARSVDGAANSYSAVMALLDTAKTPSVSLSSPVKAYRFDPGILFNETTGQKVTLRTVASTGDALRVPAAEGDALNLEVPLEEGGSIFSGIEWSDEDRKFTLAPGLNVISYLEPGVAGVSVNVEAQPCWE